MHFNFVVYFTVLLSITSASSTTRGVQRLFPEATEYIYKLETVISSGTEVPVKFPSYSSVVAELSVQKYNTTWLRYRFLDVQTATYNGMTRMSSSDFPAAAMILKEPWDGYYDESGALTAVHHSKDEPYWSGNIKRAIALNLQITQPDKANSLSYSIQEPCLHGICIVEYTSPDGKTIRKTNDIPTSQPGFGRFFWSSVPVDTCYDRELKYPFVGSAEKIYKLNGDKGLVNLHSRSALQYYTSSQVFAVNTEIKFTLERTSALKPSTNLSLHYSYPVYYPHNYKQPYNGRLVKEQSKLAELANEYLIKISKEIDENRVGPNIELVHNLDIIELQKIMSQLEYDTLMKLYQDFAVGTSYEAETSRNIFFEMIPHLKSSASALFVKYLVIEHKQTIEDTTLLSLIRKLPFNVANYSEDLLTNMEAFTILGTDFKRDIRYACILSYATLAYHTYTNGGCTTDYFGHIVTKYFNMYTNYPSYQDRLIWLQGLSNLQVGSVHNYLAPKILNSSTDEHERFLGLWATIPNVAADSSLSSLLSWPIFTNENEPIKLRIAALLQILSVAEQTPGRLLDIHKYIMRSENGQLKKFWQTTAYSLETTEYNCCPSARYMPRITKEKIKTDPTHWATGNYIYDLSSKNNRGSAYIQFMGIGEPSTNLPEFAYFHLRTTRDGSVVDDLGVMLIIEGLPLHVYTKLSSLTSRNGTLDSLVNLLRRLKVKTKQTEKVHIDVIVKMHDKTVYATHLNHTTLNAWEGQELQSYVQNFLQSGSHINQQLVSFPMQVEQDLATEYGTPVTLLNTMTSLTSLRGGLSASWIKDKFTFETDLTFRYRGTALTSLSVIEPIVFSEYTTRAQQSFAVELPIKFKIDTQLDNKTLRYNVYQPSAGIAVHGRSQTQVTWETNDSNGTSTIVDTVGDNKQRKDRPMAFADCKDLNTYKEIMRSHTTTTDAKIRFFISSLSTDFIIRHGMIIMTMHPSGSCGYYISRKNESPVQIGLTLMEHNEKFGNLTLRIDQEVKIPNSLPDVLYQQDITYSLNSANDRIIQQLSIGSSTWDRLMCISESDVSTSTTPDTSELPADHAGQFRVYLGPYRNNTCPQDFDAFNTLLLDYQVENAGLYSDVGITRYMTLKAIGKMEEPWIRYVSEFLKMPYPGESFFNYTIRTEEYNGIVAHSVDGGHQTYYKSEKVEELLENLSTIQLLRKIGIYKKCTLQENSVQTFSGVFESFKSKNCEENLVLAECTQKPGFAITRNKNGTYNFYIANDKVSIAPPMLGLVFIRVNGAIMLDLGQGYTNPGKTFKISTSGESVLIETIESEIRLYYTPRETSILIPTPYLSLVCGECTSQYAYNDC